MPIRVLSSELISKIAAGEVVDTAPPQSSDFPLARGDEEADSAISLQFLSSEAISKLYIT